MQIFTGFSKLNKAERIGVLRSNASLEDEQIKLLAAFQGNDKMLDEVIERLSENYIANYALPFGIAPNFLVNDKIYFVPMVTEESSVVAAAAYAARFWSDKGGFRAKIVGTKKSGQIYFTWSGDAKRLMADFPVLKDRLLAVAKPLTSNMEKRGAGIFDITLSDASAKNDYYTINIDFETADSMGANLINSCLEAMCPELLLFLKDNYPEVKPDAEIVMAILSNYTPDCLVECSVECRISEFSQISGNLSSDQFALKFQKAVMIAQENRQRAVTHNKGIFNGIDAVLISTGNDFRAVEACGHAYASKDGSYSSLTSIEIRGNSFKYTLRIPLSLGTVGGVTSVHPLAKLALRIMGNPSAKELMGIVAAVGLASNFAAIRSLITDGIQKGHMRLHLNNILYQFNANDFEKGRVEEYFKHRQVSFKAVSDYINSLREKA